jgi:hypothetical protein
MPFFSPEDSHLIRKLSTEWREVLISLVEIMLTWQNLMKEESSLMRYYNLKRAIKSLQSFGYVIIDSKE